MVDAGHGGSDYGATFQGRREKDDVLRLALAVGEILEQNGVEVEYTRVTDIYDSPVRKAQLGNESGADFFLSLHRNSGVNPNTYNGVQTLLYDSTGTKAEMANNINANLEQVGYQNLGIDIRKDLAVLRRTQMPALLVEAGFINNDKDNQIFDNSFDATARAIADGVLETLGMRNASNQQPFSGQEFYRDTAPAFSRQGTTNRRMEFYQQDDMEVQEEFIEQEMTMPEENQEYSYRVQVGLYRNYQNAADLEAKMDSLGLPVQIQKSGNYFSVQVGNLDSLEEGTALEQDLRMLGFDTLLIAV